MVQTAEAEVPASSDERVEAFAEFLDELEDQNSAAGDQPTAEEASDPSDADAPKGADEPDAFEEKDGPAIVPPVSWGQDAAELFETSPESISPRAARRAASTTRSAH